MLSHFVVKLARSPFGIPHFRALLRACILLCLCSITALAQYRIDHWTTDNGLPQNTVRSVVQTRDGYLWLTTFDGLARFDSVRFTIFDKSNTPALTNNRITSLYEGHDGTLWIGSDQGELVAYRNGVFTAYATSERLRREAILGCGLDLNDEMLIITDPGAYYIRRRAHYGTVHTSQATRLIFYHPDYSSRPAPKPSTFRGFRPLRLFRC